MVVVLEINLYRFGLASIVASIRAPGWLANRSNFSSVSSTNFPRCVAQLIKSYTS